MRGPFLLLITSFFFCQNLPAQSVEQQTTGDQSPTLVAENILITYGISPAITLELTKVYEKEGLSDQERNRLVQSLIKKYKNLSGIRDELSEEDKKELGIKDREEIANILNYDIFLSSKGNQSPVVYAPGGYAEIWYGIPPKAFKGIWHILEKKQVAIDVFEKKLKEQVERYTELEKELAKRVDYDDVAARAKALLDRGDIEEAERILEEDVLSNNKQSAYRNFQVGKVKELNLKYREATEYLSLAVTLDKSNPKYHLSFGNNLAWRGKYDEAIMAYQEALNLYMQQSGQSEQQVSVLMNNIGQILSVKGYYASAISFFQEALSIDTVTAGQIHPNVALSYYHLGNVYVALGNYENAIYYLNMAFKIDTLIYGIEHSKIALNLNSLGIVFEEKGDYKEAITLYEKALLISLETNGNYHPSTGFYLDNLGSAHQKAGDYEKAWLLHQKALHIDTTLYGNWHPNIARIYHHLGRIMYLTGKYRESIFYHRQALNIDIEFLGERSPEVAKGYNNLGQSIQELGNYREAISYHKKALAINEDVFGEIHSNVSVSLDYVGKCYSGLEDHDNAISFQKKAIHIDSILEYPDPGKTSILYNNLGLTYYNNGDDKNAKLCFEKALMFWERSGNPNARNLAQIYNSLGLIYTSYYKSYDIALGYFKEAIRINKNSIGENHSSVGINYTNMGHLYYSKGEDSLSIQSFQKGLSILFELLPINHPTVQYQNNGFIIILSKIGRKNHEKENFLEAINIFKLALSYSQKGKNLRYTMGNYDTLFSMYRELRQCDSVLVHAEQMKSFTEKLRVDLDEQFARLPVSERTTNLPNYRAVQQDIEKMNQSILLTEAICLKDLGEIKQANEIFLRVRQWALTENNPNLLERLKKEGY